MVSSENQNGLSMLPGFLTMILAMGFIRQNLLDWGWMKDQSVVEKTEHTRDVHVEQPFTIKCAAGSGW